MSLLSSLRHGHRHRHAPMPCSSRTGPRRALICVVLLAPEVLWERRGHIPKQSVVGAETTTFFRMEVPSGKAHHPHRRGSRHRQSARSILGSSRSPRGSRGIRRPNGVHTIISRGERGPLRPRLRPAAALRSGRSDDGTTSLDLRHQPVPLRSRGGCSRCSRAGGTDEGRSRAGGQGRSGQCGLGGIISLVRRRRGGRSCRRAISTRQEGSCQEKDYDTHGSGRGGKHLEIVFLELLGGEE